MSDAPDTGRGDPLSLPPVERIAEELERPAADAPEHAEADAELAAMAERFVAETLEAEGEGAADRQRRAVDEMGLELQQQAARQSEMLKTPLRKLARHGEEGGPVAKALVELRGRMEALDPRHHRLTPGPMDRVLRLLPGTSSRLQRYFHRFETAQQALEAIIADLQGGRDMLDRDNLTLSDDQEAMRATLEQLARQVALGRLIDDRLSAALADIADESRRRFVEEELLFPLRQRILDLQQQQAVCQQGVLALEVIIRNNRELMRGVDRAINVTVSALSVAATVALALANQRLVLDRIESLNAATSETIAGTARALRQQGVDIQTRAASANLDMKALEGAFADVMAAVDDLASYRREALPRLGEQIERLETLSHRGQAAIERLDRGGEARGDGPDG
ncbi:toxic anion resistance protein [Halomonas koreensis]|uniref:Toxic anion resistance protein n=1 Tax=Halomonas koreensis TaxID=245385 RepID=A0ABU1FXU7_9GAMM|nr:toxic anion resistance protein [Halomonas koreensis]MDR5865173.1 toxic anion resistance protein [Halomonas koreensis]